jgi:hypothetical protein
MDATNSTLLVWGPNMNLYTDIWTHGTENYQIQVRRIEKMWRRKATQFVFFKQFCWDEEWSIEQKMEESIMAYNIRIGNLGRRGHLKELGEICKLRNTEKDQR